MAVFSNHFNYRHIINNHNDLRHSVPSFKETWKNLNGRTVYLHSSFLLLRSTLFLRSDTGSGTPFSLPRLHQSWTTFSKNLPWTWSIMIILNKSKNILPWRSGKGIKIEICSTHLLLQRDLSTECGIIHPGNNTSNSFVDKKDTGKKLYLLHLLPWQMDVWEVLCCAHCGHCYKWGK